MRSVSIVSIGQLPVMKAYPQSLGQMAAAAIHAAMEAASVDRVDALYVGNMLADELQHQKHLGAYIADEAGLFGIGVASERPQPAGLLRCAWLIWLSRVAK